MTIMILIASPTFIGEVSILLSDLIVNVLEQGGSLTTTTLVAAPLHSMPTLIATLWRFSMVMVLDHHNFYVCPIGLPEDRTNELIHDKIYGYPSQFIANQYSP
jgi:hypothetical protein